jgi:tRNA 2-thiouridine synthesizing protein E
VHSFEQSGGSPRKYTRSIAGRSVLFDKEGFLWQPGDWNEEIAEALARESGLESLDESHWQVIRFLREFYYNNGRAPLNRQLVAGTAISLLEIEKLFPGGIKYGARRVAGLPNPKNCL